MENNPNNVQQTNPGIGQQVTNQQDALKEIQEIKAQLKEKEEKEKSSKLLGYMVSSYVIGAVGFVTAVILNKSVAGVDTESISMITGSSTDLISMMVKAGWVVGYAGVGVGLLLTTFYLKSVLTKKNANPGQENNPEDSSKI